MAIKKYHMLTVGKGTKKTNGRKTIISIIEVMAIIARLFLLFLTIALQLAWQRAANKIIKNIKLTDKSYWFYI